MIRAPTKALYEDHTRHNVRYVMKVYTLKIYYSEARGFFLPEWSIEGLPSLGELINHIDKELNGTKEN